MDFKEMFRSNIEFSTSQALQEVNYSSELACLDSILLHPSKEVCNHKINK